MTPGLLFAVALAGGVGATCRYMLDFTITSRTGSSMPWGTALVNISGSFGLGVLLGLDMTVSIPETLRIAVAAGFLGAYTTFSTWMYEILRLLEQRAWSVAMVHALGSLLLGLAAAALGLWIGRSI